MHVVDDCGGEPRIELAREHGVPQGVHEADVAEAKPHHELCLAADTLVDVPGAGGGSSHSHARGLGSSAPTVGLG